MLGLTTASIQAAGELTASLAGAQPRFDGKNRIDPPAD